MMTRKDYVETADILAAFRDEIEPETFNDMVLEFSEWFMKENERFRSDKFEAACNSQN